MDLQSFLISMSGYIKLALAVFIILWVSSFIHRKYMKESCPFEAHKTKIALLSMRYLIPSLIIVVGLFMTVVSTSIPNKRHLESRSEYINSIPVRSTEAIINDMTPQRKSNQTSKEEFDKLVEY